MVRCIYTISVVCIGFFAGQLYAYPTPVDFNGQLSRWDDVHPGSPVLYRLAGDASIVGAMHTTVAEAAALWSSVDNSYFRFAEATEGEGERVLIRFESGLDDAAYSAGYAMFDELDSELRPKHCEITIDSRQSGLAKTLLHEMGHCAGLGHSIVPESIMSYRDDKNRFALDTDDAAAIARLYPEGSGHAKLPPGCSVSSTSETSQLGLLIMTILPILLLLP